MESNQTAWKRMQKEEDLSKLIRFVVRVSAKASYDPILSSNETSFNFS